ncbi:MAG: TetR/AcrR family transcriptional regulator [Methanotrichaceae archaeon]|nr:TetR/AcrR family transcriptional regulator [Methanotrichaceae archaeon]
MAAKRVTKDPEERKCELIDAAERLFASRGYEETAISEIVKEVKVSQGAFYYYFQSKEDVLVAVIKKNMLQMEQDVRAVAGRDDLEDPEKLNLIFNRFMDLGISGRQTFTYIHQHKSPTMHRKLMSDNPLARIAPLVAGVIAHGKAEGRFQVDHPLENATLLLILLGSSLHAFYKLESRQGAGSIGRQETDGLSLNRMRLALEDMLTKVLGSQDYRFKLEAWESKNFVEGESHN